MKKFYLDTSIWIDIYEDRRGFHNEPLGKYGLKLLYQIKNKGYILVISDILLIELEGRYSLAEINGMFKFFEDHIEKVKSTTEQTGEARKLSNNRNVPMGDALHAILARDNELILITRDNDFKKLKDISKFSKPEEFI